LKEYSRDWAISEKGKPVISFVSSCRRNVESMVAAQCSDTKEVIAPFSYRGTMDAGLFEWWLEHQFIPALDDPSSSALILDNAKCHNKIEIEFIAEKYGLTVLFLPPYSPDKNPIEKLWANIKKWLRLNMNSIGDLTASLMQCFVYLETLELST